MRKQDNDYIDLKNMKDRDRVFSKFNKEQKEMFKSIQDNIFTFVEAKSGTGKTLVAVQRAIMLNRDGEKVLFLCYNRNLAVELAQKHKELENVSFYTLDSLACRKCSTTWDKVSYYDLKDVLETEILDGTFEYQHIIVDEGQDFGS